VRGQGVSSSGIPLRPHESEITGAVQKIEGLEKQHQNSGAFCNKTQNQPPLPNYTKKARNGAGTHPHTTGPLVLGVIWILV